MNEYVGGWVGIYIHVCMDKWMSGWVDRKIIDSKDNIILSSLHVTASKP